MQTTGNINLHLEAVSNFSLFFFLRHFQGLKNRPNALNLLFLSSGGDLAHGPRLFVLMIAPLCCFWPAILNIRIKIRSGPERVKLVHKTYTTK